MAGPAGGARRTGRSAPEQRHHGVAAAGSPARARARARRRAPTTARDQSSAYWSASRATAGFSATLASRRSAVVRFGLWSTALYDRVAVSAKTTGTRCGRPAASAVASRATRAAAKRRARLAGGHCRGGRRPRASKASSARSIDRAPGRRQPVGHAPHARRRVRSSASASAGTPKTSTGIVAPGLRGARAQLGDALAAALARVRASTVAERQHAVEHRRAVAADEHRRVRPLQPAWARTRSGRSRRTRRGRWPRPASRSPSSPRPARASRRIRVRGSVPWLAISSRFQPAPTPKSKRPPERRSTLATSFAVMIGSRCDDQADAAADAQPAWSRRPRPSARRTGRACARTCAAAGRRRATASRGSPGCACARRRTARRGRAPRRAGRGPPGPTASWVGKSPMPVSMTGRVSERQLTVMENVRSAKAPRVSVARTVKENAPRVVGVPVIRPGLACRRRPGGRAPARSVQV